MNARLKDITLLCLAYLKENGKTSRKPKRQQPQVRNLRDLNEHLLQPSRTQ